MMKALIDIPLEVNQTLNIIKAKYNLKNKVEAITLVVKTYEQEHMEPELLPAFVQKIKSTEHKKPIKVKNLHDRYK
jgi:pyruvate-formate lyase-activating enzyme